MTDTPCNVTAGCEPCTLPSEPGCKYVKCTKEVREQVREYDHLHTVEEHIIHKPKCKIQYVAVHHQAPCQKVVVGCPCTCPDSQDGFVRAECHAPAVQPLHVAAAAAAAVADKEIAVADVQVQGFLPPGARIIAESFAVNAAPAPAVAPVVVKQPIIVTHTAPVQQQPQPQPQQQPQQISMAYNPSTGYGYRWIPAGM